MMDLIKYNILSQILADIIIRPKRTIFLSAVFDIDSRFAHIHVYYVEHYKKMQYWFQWICLICMTLSSKENVAEFLNVSVFSANYLLLWRSKFHFWSQLSEVLSIN